MRNDTPVRFTIAIISLVLVARCGEGPASSPKAPGVPVVTAMVAKRDIPQQKSYPGIVASPRTIELAARVEGFLMKQEVPDGAVTTPGQVIYRIDPRPFEAAVLAAEGQLAEAVAQRNYAKTERDRNEPLVKVNAISQQVFDGLVTKDETAEAQVLVAQANLTEAKINLSYCTMSSPFNGLLGASQYFEGAVVGTLPTVNLNSLVQIDPLWVQFSPSSVEWPQYQALLSKGSVQVSIDTDGASPAHADGQIVFADNTVSTSTSTLMMRAEFKNPTGVFRPGAYAQVRVVLGQLIGATVFPERAAFAREADLFVWRVKSDGTVESVLIKPILVHEGDLVFTGQLNVGDRVVVDGMQRLKTGTPVVEAPSQPTVVPPAPAAAEEKSH